MTWGNFWLASFAPKLAGVFIIMIAIELAVSLLKLSTEEGTRSERDE